MVTNTSESDAPKAEAGIKTGLTVDRHRREQELKKSRDARRTFIRRGIDESYHYLSVGDTARLAKLLAALADRIGITTARLGPLAPIIPDGHVFYLAELRLFIEGVKRYDETAALRNVVQGSPEAVSEHGAAKMVLQSLTAVAAAKELLPSQLQDTQPVQGFRTKVGERYVRPESQATGEITLRDPDEDLKSTLCAGGKGSGKSTAVETLALDSYQNGHKIVDIVDFFKVENATYDLPQLENGEGLMEARREMGLSTGYDDLKAGFAWLDDELDPELFPSPDVEILVPLCPGLENIKIPAVNGEHSVVRPFTIPASDLKYRQLVMLLHHTTKARENELRSAHQRLDNRDLDWTLSDVAAEIKRSGNASQKLATSIETSLRTAQQKSFVRDQDCPYALDWESIMADQSTITMFSVAPVKETADHLVLLSYLIDSLFEARRGLIDKSTLEQYPPLTTIMREMSEVAPRSTSEQSAESTSERYMIDSLKKIFKLTRHANLEIIADAQKFYRQLSPDISELFDQILAFQGHVPDIQRIFSTRVNDKGPAEYVAQYEESGKCALISEQGYRLPVQFAPPRCHHLEAKSDGSGLGFRARHPDTAEELIDPPWNVSVPPRLKFDDMPEHPVDRFLKQYVHLVDDWDEYLLMDDLYEAYCEWAAEKDEEQFERKIISGRLSSYFDPIGSDTLYRPRINGSQFRAHRRLELSW